MVDFTPEQKEWFQKNLRCPFCGSDQVTVGPEGGASQNLFCDGTWIDITNGQTQPCGARFNHTPFGTELVDMSKVHPKRGRTRSERTRPKGT